MPLDAFLSPNTPIDLPEEAEKGARIDVENPNPGQRPGQVHFQQGKEKYLYDPTTKSFPDAPKAVNELLKDSGFQRGIEKAMKILGEQ